MASAKIATLVIRTLAKPISNRIKEQVRQHETFRTLCVDLAQFMYRSEVKLRTNILGEPARHIRPLSEAKAIENGTNALAEGFLFTVAAALIIGETWRSSRNSSKRRDSVDDQLEDLGTRLTELTTRVDALVTLVGRWEDEEGREKMRDEELAQILERVVEIGLRGTGAGDRDPLLKDSSLAAIAQAVDDAEARTRAGTSTSIEPSLLSDSSSTSTPSTPTPTPTPKPSASTSSSRERTPTPSESS